MKKIILILACIILFSCKKNQVTNSSFQSCNIEKSSKTQLLTNQAGTLSYTNKISSSPITDFVYIIYVTGQLPLQVCNMSTSMKLNENETKNVVFSGKMVILPDEVDAISTQLELSKLKFNN